MFAPERRQLKLLRGYLILMRCVVVIVISILASLFLEHSVDAVIAISAVIKQSKKPVPCLGCKLKLVCRMRGKQQPSLKDSTASISQTLCQCNGNNSARQYTSSTVQQLY